MATLIDLKKKISKISFSLSQADGMKTSSKDDQIQGAIHQAVGSMK